MHDSQEKLWSPERLAGFVRQFWRARGHARPATVRPAPHLRPGKSRGVLAQRERDSDGSGSGVGGPLGGRVGCGQVGVLVGWVHAARQADHVNPRLRRSEGVALRTPNAVISVAGVHRDGYPHFFLCRFPNGRGWRDARAETQVNHTDRGSPHTSHDYRERTEEFGMQASVSKAGDSADNAPVERIFAALNWRRKWSSVTASSQKRTVDGGYLTT
jgi:hypothetical protein